MKPNDCTCFGLTAENIVANKQEASLALHGKGHYSATFFTVPIITVWTTKTSQRCNVCVASGKQ